VTRPPTGPLWVHQIKHDGYRLMVRRDGFERQPCCHIKLQWNSGRERNFTMMDRKKTRSAEETMARNFGVPRQTNWHERAPVWPTWLMTFAIRFGIINPAKFP
jgi:hypothetical protein